MSLLHRESFPALPAGWILSYFLDQVSGRASLLSRLLAKILAAAPQQFADTSTAATAPDARPETRVTTPAPPKHRIQFREVLAWCAAAACFIFAIVNWTTSHSTARLASPRATAEFLKDTPDAIKLSWAATEEPAAKGASGEVLWSNAKQKGFMPFKGLAKNDPKTRQYQLWIFDAKQDERYPVDGGVFDIDSATGDVIVPIDTKLRVIDPKMFASTNEKPGGVVVSDRKHIALLAKKDS
ncbi:MAG TPA: anti-sigma factor [Lacipirellulaceae bacterium]|nr:anti-sigma factor [Lacipirellulaceae bacterium]